MKPELVQYNPLYRSEVSMLSLLLVPLALAAVPTEPGDLVITEIMAYPDVVPIYSGEWFEIYNASSETLDLSGLRVLGEGAKDSGFIIEELSLAAGAYAVLGVSDCSDASTCKGTAYNGGVDVDYVYTRDDLDLDESGDTITLTAWVDGRAVTIDTVSWDSTSWNFQKDYALQANVNAYYLEWANNLSGNWCSSESPYGELALYGTPGAANSPCDGSTADLDKDGYTPADGDCNDDDAYVNPGAVDGIAHYDGTGEYDDGEGCCGYPDDDANCNGARDDGLIDSDGDGFSPVAGDCDDSNELIHPLAEENIADEIDNNCNGCIDDETLCNPLDTDDRDGDGFTAEDGDCDDLRASTNPGADEVPYDGIDNDCDGVDVTDVDGDGLDGLLAGGEDCDDEDAAVGEASLWYFDGDGDGYGDGEVPFAACEAPPGFVTDTTDCDDTNGTTNPGADEITCDGIDNDCDGVAVEGGACELPTGVTPEGCQSAPMSVAPSWWLALLPLLWVRIRTR